MNYTPVTITPLDMAFGGRAMEILPPYAKIPDEFKRSRGTRWNKIVSKWFFSGIGGAKFQAKAGIDEKMALANLGCVLGSFEPKHEHKEAGAAYLMSLWFDSVELPQEAQP
jgi:hypothetical protein